MATTWHKVRIEFYINGEKQTANCTNLEWRYSSPEGKAAMEQVEKDLVANWTGDPTYGGLFEQIYRQTVKRYHGTILEEWEDFDLCDCKTEGNPVA